MTGKRHILLAGCGKMGGAMLAGWLADKDLQAEFSILDPIASEVGAPIFNSPAEWQAAGLPVPDIIVLAVKPQLMAEVAPGLRALAGPQTAYLSIAAGLSSGGLADLFGSGAAIIRSMPNLPATVRQGITALYANAAVSPHQLQLADQLLGAIGSVVQLEDESLMDAVTALSGSGPAYVFLLAEVMQQAGEALGLEAALASQLARQTVIGAAALLNEAAEPASVLRENVTSKGGTTAAALSVLMGPDGLDQLMERAMQAARDRGRALGS